MTTDPREHLRWLASLTGPARGDVRLRDEIVTAVHATRVDRPELADGRLGLEGR